MIHLPSTPQSRREFIARTALSAAGLALAASPIGCASPAPRARIPVGVQLYSVREQCKTDFPGTLKAVAAIGYKGVEFAGYHGRSATEIRSMLDDLGLVACGTHAPFESLLPAELDQTIEFNQAIGNKFLICPWMTGKSRTEWLDKAAVFNDLAAKVRPHGMFVGYHAHAHDFQKFDGVTAWDLFFGNTKPEVIMQLDTSNCAEGGAEAVAVLKKYPGRAKSIHIKPHGGPDEAVIGEDKVNWPGVFEFCETAGGTQWYVVEHEKSADPLATLKRTFAALHGMGKV